MEIQNNTPAVLLYGLPPFSTGGAAVRAWLKTKGIRAITVSSADGGKTLSTLLDLQKEAAGMALPLPKEPVVVLYGLMGPLFDEFLDLLRSQAPTELKATATPFNLHWTFGRLATELEKERRTRS